MIDETDKSYIIQIPLGKLFLKRSHCTTKRSFFIYLKENFDLNLFPLLLPKRTVP